jgi:hypothetical protein
VLYTYEKVIENGVLSTALQRAPLAALAYFRALTPGFHGIKPPFLTFSTFIPAFSHPGVVDNHWSCLFL